VVVPQHATKPLAARDVTSDGTDIVARLNQLIGKSLMIPLRAVMLGVLTQGMPKLEQERYVRRPRIAILPMPRGEIKRLRKENPGCRKALHSQRFEFGTVF